MPKSAGDILCCDTDQLSKDRPISLLEPFVSTVHCHSALCMGMTVRAVLNA